MKSGSRRKTRGGFRVWNARRFPGRLVAKESEQPGSSTAPALRAGSALRSFAFGFLPYSPTLGFPFRLQEIAPIAGSLPHAYARHMNDSTHPNFAKTVVHGRPASEITDDDVEQRARELAVIQGRNPDEITNDLRVQARDELLGHSAPDSTAQDDESIGRISRDPSNPPDIYAKQKPNFSEPSEQDELEHMVLDGVEEAQHDQMLEARKKRET